MNSVEPRAAQLPVLQLGREALAAARQARRDRHADADRIVDLVRDAGDQAAERGQLLGLDQALLGVAQLGQRLLGALLGGAQLLLGAPLGDGVLAEHLDRARHLADLVARLEPAHAGFRSCRRRSHASRVMQLAAAAR